ncbi:MAG: hypothetical protein HYS27_00565 [Deltaproteobacteria bacterium]|nr:hypothetical protein [Deltaproteobacteria bacterium]
MSIPKSAQASIEAAVKAAERGTRGEIVVAVTRQSDAYGGPRLAFAFAIGLLAVVGALMLDAPSWLVALAWPLAGVLGFAVTLVPAVGRAIVPDDEVEAEVLESAKAAFFDHGVHRTADRAGVLVYLSLLERRVVVLADSGVHAVVGEQGWQAHVAAIVASMREGHPEALAGVVAAVGAVLVEHFPARPGDVNELPDAPRVG